MARAARGVFHLRIDDIDQSRSRAHWETQIQDDLHWLGLSWPEPVWRQSERVKRYKETLVSLWNRRLIYPCTCSRRDIAAAANAPQEGAPILGPDGVIYPGTCRDKPRPDQMVEGCALRLDMKRAMEGIDYVEFVETGMAHGMHHVTRGEMIETVGDVVLARRDMAASYHLSIALDDADQGITHVVRGEDLIEATKIHVVLQRLLGLPTPTYHHHRLIRDDAGKRLAKRDDARAIATYRAEGKTPQDIRAMVGL